jgi:hypothetical protein
LEDKNQTTGETYKRLKDKYDFVNRGIIHVKRKGRMMIYFLGGEKKSLKKLYPRAFLLFYATNNH